MDSISKSRRPESDARDRRVAALISALDQESRSQFREEDVIELCLAFDQAVEFAACEAKPVSTAIEEFMQEDWGPAQAALRKLVTPATPFFPPKLPVLPRAAAQLLRTREESVTAPELERIAGSDPALASQLLRAANSALYGPRWKICRLRDAIMRVGVPAARHVLLAASFSSFFATRLLDGVWQHSQNVAGGALQIAKSSGVDPESAYAAGLLHDLGRVAFTVFPSPMRAAERRWRDAGFPLIYAETMAYGCDHAAFGSTLLRAWQLPEEIVDAVGHHHRPDRSDNPLQAVVHLAEAADEDLWSGMRREAALNQTGIGAEDLNLILRRNAEPGTSWGVLTARHADPFQQAPQIC